MFDFSMSEILIIGVVALIAIGPKELPGALKTFAYWTKQARKLAREFQSGVDDLIREAELDEARKAVEDARRNINQEIEQTVDPGGEMRKVLAEDPTGPSVPTPSIGATPSAPAVAAPPASEPAAAPVAEPAAAPAEDPKPAAAGELQKTA
ncbi:MAG TPA: Sec-independent protein translocase protein TatB [Methylomirabilota bacterium]|nr:Sec-independent protein translocase protein TatB [Methylomirabilota bacterium]